MGLDVLPLRAVFKNRNFTLLWMGQSISVLGDQFEMIAAPWLVLNLTKDPLALGAVLALSSIPRALFMLLGGAFTDRFSPRTVMLVSDAVRLVLTAGLSALIFMGAVQTWMLYVFSLLFGIVSGFFSPAAGSMVPHLLEKDGLQAGNALMQGTAQLSNFLGPALAGGLIALFHDAFPGSAAQGLEGVALAFAFDALSFLASILTLLGMDRFSRPAAGAEGVLSSIKSGIRFAASHPTLRIVFILIGFGNLFFVGPLMVGIPVLAQQRLAEGAAALGLVMSAYGGGNLIGILSAGSLPRPRSRQLNWLVVGLIASFATGLGLLAFVQSTWEAFAVLLVVGLGNGYLTITALTLLQQRTPSALLGRMMSLVLFANIGLTPVSQALAGFFIKMSLEGLFLGAGLCMALLAVWVCFDHEARRLGDGILGSRALD